MAELFCPECEYQFKLGFHPQIGQRVVCPKCKTNLEIINLSPLELDWAMPANYPANPKKKPNKVGVTCPECNQPIKLNPRLKPGQEVICSACHTLLEVINTTPLELDVAESINLKQNPQERIDRKKYVTRRTGQGRKENSRSL